MSSEVPATTTPYRLCRGWGGVVGGTCYYYLLLLTDCAVGGEVSSEVPFAGKGLLAVRTGVAVGGGGQVVLQGFGRRVLVVTLRAPEISATKAIYVNYIKVLISYACPPSPEYGDIV